MLRDKEDFILDLIQKLKAAIDRMVARGERVPFEVEEKVYLIEQLLLDGRRAVDAEKH